MNQDRPKTAAEVLAMLQPVGQLAAGVPEKPRLRATPGARRGAAPRGGTENHPPGVTTATPGQPAATGGADAEELDDEQAVRDEGAAKLERALTQEDALKMVASTARRALLVIENPTAKDSDKKHAAVSMGVAIDKWIALTSRPGRSEMPAEAESARPGALELGRRLIEATREQLGPPTANQNGTPASHRP